MKPLFGVGSSNALLIKGREAKCANLLAENDIISPEGLKANLSYTLITQREPDNQVLQTSTFNGRVSVMAKSLVTLMTKMARLFVCMPFEF